MQITRRISLSALAALTAVVALVIAAATQASPGPIDAKREQARQVLAEIQQLDSKLNRATEAYNAANWKLSLTRTALRQNKRMLGIAERNLTAANSLLAQQVLRLYKTGDPSAIELILGASNFDEMLRQLETMDRLSSQQRAILDDVHTFQTDVARQRVKLSRTRHRQQLLVRERARQRDVIRTQLGERQRLLASVQAEVATLQRAEARRQEALALQARARVAAMAQQRSVLAADEPSFGAIAVTPEGATALPSSRYSSVVGIAMQYLGVPYVWGGASPSGFDCSGLIMYTYAQIGVSLPHYTGAQYQLGSPVPIDQLQPGDLVFFDGLGHAGIYIGANQFIHAPHTGDVVKISPITGWYASRWVGARRL
jgi:peptidoglycan DL-endopeptidase CwlO